MHLLRFIGRGLQFMLMSVLFFPLLVLWLILGFVMLVVEAWEKTK
jgi:hypothetical protein